MRNYVELLFSGFVILLLAGCAATRTSDMPTPFPAVRAGTAQGPDPSVLVHAYKMAVDDVVQVTVFDKPELSATQPIRPDGKIVLPLIGVVAAAGREPEELAADIKQRLSTYVKDPNVSVILTSLKGNEFLSRIRVTGSVVRNSSFSYRQGMTVLDAVLEAGGVDDYADGNHTKLHRRISKKDQPGEELETYDIRLEDIMKKGDMTTNMLLLPGDIITVPERWF